MIIIVEYRNRVKAYRIKTNVRIRSRFTKEGGIEKGAWISGANYEEITLDEVAKLRNAGEFGELVLTIGGKEGATTLPHFPDDIDGAVI